jgi:hypothetical protein
MDLSQPRLIAAAAAWERWKEQWAGMRGLRLSALFFLWMTFLVLSCAWHVWGYFEKTNSHPEGLSIWMDGIHRNLELAPGLLVLWIGSLVVMIVAWRKRGVGDGAAKSG